MITRLKIKFVCINMMIVTLMLGIIFGMVLYNTNRNMEEQGRRALQIIHEDSFRKNPIPKGNRIPYFTVMVSPEKELSVYSSSHFSLEEDWDLLEIAREVYDSGEKQGVLKEHALRFSRMRAHKGELMVFMDISVERRVLSDLIQTCLKIGTVSYVLFLGISILLAQWAIRPVERAWKNQKQFVADASHELKTPLTVIMTNAELLQDTSYPQNFRKQFLESILVMSHQMRGLVEGLLDLARVDNGVVKTTFADLNFSSIIENCLLQFEPVFFENEMQMNSDVEQDIVIKGSTLHLRQVADILLDNAAKYGKAGSTVEICLHRQGYQVLFSVSSAGDAISKEDLKNIFKRFYRIDKARSMNQSYGLGLPIAQGIVEEHRGKIWAESKNGRNTFFVQLPVPFRR